MNAKTRQDIEMSFGFRVNLKSSFIHVIAIQDVYIKHIIKLKQSKIMGYRYGFFVSESSQNEVSRVFAKSVTKLQRGSRK